MDRLACPACSAADHVVSIKLTLEKGDRVAFYSCYRCDKRWWHTDDGESVSLGNVLDMARRTPAVRAAS